jgi:PRTRC genetic system protein C
MQASAMRREFSFLGIRLPDPDSRMTVEDVRGVLSMQYPEIATAAISGPEAVGDTMRYTFERAIEIRGASAFFGGVPFQGFCV